MKTLILCRLISIHLYLGICRDGLSPGLDVNLGGGVLVC